mmetsp:Transcript_8647/g.21518  ORF Transcript_8647/g.21518 Transcript_8647/m.21518 type:complete len:216 (+) Transcript_8647:1056-1703(+)
MPGPRVPHPLENLPHTHGDRRLPRPGRAGKRHVKGRHGGLEPQLLPHLIHDQQRGNLVHPLLHRRQPNQLPIQRQQLLPHALLVHVLVDRPDLRVVRDRVHLVDLPLPPLAQLDLRRRALRSGLLDQALLEVRLLQRVGKTARHALHGDERARVRRGRAARRGGAGRDGLAEEGGGGEGGRCDEVEHGGSEVGSRGVGRKGGWETPAGVVQEGSN